MARTFRRLMRERAYRNGLGQWVRRAETMPALSRGAVARLRSHAAELREVLDRVLFDAERRLLADAPAIRPVPWPPGADWAWRPDPWAGPITPHALVAPASATPLAGDVTLFHDGRLAEVLVRQKAGSGAEPAAPFCVVVETLGFDGGFVSLTLELPAEASAGLRRRHILRLDLAAGCEHPLAGFARLNIGQGPEVAQLVQAFHPDGSVRTIEFDLAGIDIDEKRIGRLWIDLILEQPAMNRVTLHDVTASRLPRAEI